MSDSSFCSQDVTLPLSIISATLLVLSELLGSQGDKGDKCTSMVQFICAACIYCYRKCLNAYHSCCCGQKTVTLSDDTSSIAAEVSKNVVIPSMPSMASMANLTAFDYRPTWRRPKAARPVIPFHQTETLRGGTSASTSTTGLV